MIFKIVKKQNMEHVNSKYKYSEESEKIIECAMLVHK